MSWSCYIGLMLSYIPSVVFLTVLSVRQKVPKSRAVVYGIRCFLCSRVALQHLSVGSHLAARCLSQCLGRQEIAALKHHAACFQALLGRSLCLPTLPFRRWRGITLSERKPSSFELLQQALVISLTAPVGHRMQGLKDNRNAEYNNVSSIQAKSNRKPLISNLV